MSTADEDDATCPSCGRKTLLSTGAILVIVHRLGFAGRPYGTPTAVSLAKDDPVECNSTTCGWKGTVADVRGEW